MIDDREFNNISSKDIVELYNQGLALQEQAFELYTKKFGLDNCPESARRLAFFVDFNTMSRL